MRFLSSARKPGVTTSIVRVWYAGDETDQKGVAVMAGEKMLMGLDIGSSRTRCVIGSVSRDMEK